MSSKIVVEKDPMLATELNGLKITYSKPRCNHIQELISSKTSGLPHNHKLIIKLISRVLF